MADNRDYHAPRLPSIPQGAAARIGVPRFSGGAHNLLAPAIDTKNA